MNNVIPKLVLLINLLSLFGCNFGESSINSGFEAPDISQETPQIVDSHSHQNGSQHQDSGPFEPHCHIHSGCLGVFGDMATEVTAPLFTDSLPSLDTKTSPFSSHSSDLFRPPIS